VSRVERETIVNTEICLRLRLYRNEGFPLARSCKITQHYKFSQELSDPQVPYSFS